MRVCEFRVLFTMFMKFILLAMVQIKPVPVLAAYQRTWNTRPLKTQFIAEDSQAQLNVDLSVEKSKGTSDFD